MAPSSLIRAGLLLGALAGFCGPVRAQEDPGPPPPPETTDQETAPAPPEAAPEKAEPTDPVRILLAEVDRLYEVIESQRREMAAMKLEAAETWRELEQLRQFVADNEALGRDFRSYRAVKAVAEREARIRRTEEARQRRAADKAQRALRQKEVRAEQDREQAELGRLNHYRDSGFSALGFDVYLGKMSYNYGGRGGGSPTRLDWDFRLGHYMRFYPHTYGWGRGVDFSSMTVSGSVLNASTEVRNIGVAVTFFDENGSQVGGEIVQINNARPDVPYPFTTTVAMALNRAFSSASTYVLYADSVEVPAGSP
ncbi:MAG: hypothetical protein ACYSU7_04900 [Planctomycetota bacterium]|jgi:hypothetical protein